jgi:hypothetical protein
MKTLTEIEAAAAALSSEQQQELFLFLAARLRQQRNEDLRQVWQQATTDKTPGVPVDDVLDRLEQKYQARADAQSKAK